MTSGAQPDDFRDSLAQEPPIAHLHCATRYLHGIFGTFEVV